MIRVNYIVNRRLLLILCCQLLKGGAFSSDEVSNTSVDTIVVVRLRFANKGTFVAYLTGGEVSAVHEYFKSKDLYLIFSVLGKSASSASR
jgi:hypothetical protein